MKKRKKIILIGAYPPPVGGVSIHIQRLISLLSDAADFDVIDESSVKKIDWPFNLRTLNLLKYLQIVRHAEIVHVHSGLFIRRFFHIIVCRFILRKKTVVTIHHTPSVERFTSLTKWLLSKCQHAILVNKEGYDMMITPSKCQYHMMPAFLPPVIESEPILPFEVRAWLKRKKEEHSIICVSNAWRLVLHEGEDLYGVDMCIEAVRHLKTNGYNYSLLFVVASNPTQVILMEKYKKRILNYGLEDNIMLWEQSLSFIRLILESDIVLRTTNTDGDALSIREALFYNKFVIASDVVKRPVGVHLFKSRNIESLCNSIIEYSQFDKTVNEKDSIDYTIQYKKIYGI